MKKILLIIVGIFLIGGLTLGYKINSDLSELEGAFHSEHNLQDSSIVLLRSEISPNGEFKFFEYQFDKGGFGYSRIFWSVVKNDTALTGIEKGLLPDGYKALTWTNENELLIEKWEPYYFKDEEIEITDHSTINEIKIRLKQ